MTGPAHYACGCGAILRPTTTRCPSCRAWLGDGEEPVPPPPKKKRRRKKRYASVT